MQSTITSAKLEKYFDVTKRALKKVKIVDEDKREIKFKKNAEDFLDMSEMESISEHDQKPHKANCKCRECLAKVVFDMAQRYYSDAKHFKQKGDIVTAFAALNYAHGWLDAGARLGLFDVQGDNKLFTVDPE